jgi:hypothetical protein
MGATHTKAYGRFEKVVQRSLNLLSLQKTLTDSVGKKLDLSDLVRASVVLAVAAMDAYFTGAFAEKLVPFLKERKPGSTLIELLTKAGFNTTVALEVLAMDRPYRRIRSLIEKSLELHTTQRPEAIDELFLAFGMKDFCKNAAGIAKSPNLIARVRKVVLRRNAIAHDGDLNSHGKLQPLDPAKSRRAVEDLVRFVSACDTLITRTLR